MQRLTLEMPVSVLLPAPLTCCRWELERRHMVPPSNDALRQVIERDADLVDSLNEFYGDAAADGGLDKIERELLLLVACIDPPHAVFGVHDRHHRVLLLLIPGKRSL